MVHISSLQFLLEEMSRLRAKFYVTIILKIYIQTKIEDLEPLEDKCNLLDQQLQSAKNKYQRLEKNIMEKNLFQI